MAEFPVCTSLQEMRKLQKYFQQIKTSTVQVSSASDLAIIRLSYPLEGAFEEDRLPPEVLQSAVQNYEDDTD